MAITKDLGMVTAYAYAVAGGYTGTEAEFQQLMADLAITVEDFKNFRVVISTLPAGSSATASYADGVLTLGIPKGDTGATGPQGPQGEVGQQGQKGDTGAAAGFGLVSATVDETIGTPQVRVETSGPDTQKNISFQFSGLKGDPGAGTLEFLQTGLYINENGYICQRLKGE